MKPFYPHALIEMTFLGEARHRATGAVYVIAPIRATSTTQAERTARETYPTLTDAWELTFVTA